MMGSNVAYSFREAIHHFRRNLSTALGAVSMILLSLLIIGAFLLGGALVNNAIGTVEDKVTIQAFLSNDANQDDVNALQATIAGWDGVESVQYKSKDQALEEYKESMGDTASATISALDGQNPLPASLVIKLYDSKGVADMAVRLANDDAYKAVSDNPDNAEESVQYGQGTVERLFSATNAIRLIALVVVVLLIFAAFVFINNTIRLAISARRREIAIMRLVGASNAFIRGPFLMEGMLEALVGALLAIGILQAIVAFCLPMLASTLSFLSLSISAETLFATYAFLLVMGVAIGFLGSTVALRRFLKV